jgi:transposase
MFENITVLGLDVHKDTIMAAILPAGAEHVLPPLNIQNTRAALERLVTQTRRHGALTAVYEAGPCGFDTHRHLESLGIPCAVIAPALTPVRPGDRVKTDRRDAEKLARLYRAGELTAIRVPSRPEEGARDLVRVREDVLGNRQRARNRVTKFLLRQGRRFRAGNTPWGSRHQEWMQAQHFDEPCTQQAWEALRRAQQETETHMAALSRQVEDLAQAPIFASRVQALRCLKGVDTLAAVTLLAEVQAFERFPSAPAFMAYTGLVSRENSSGSRIRRGGITKSGNAHVRRVLVEGAWSYRLVRNTVGAPLALRRRSASPEVAALGQLAQDRLHRKYWRMVSRGKPSQVAAVAVARELAGFVWAMARTIAPTGLAG